MDNDKSTPSGLNNSSASHSGAIPKWSRVYTANSQEEFTPIAIAPETMSESKTIQHQETYDVSPREAPEAPKERIPHLWIRKGTKIEPIVSRAPSDYVEDKISQKDSSFESKPLSHSLLYPRRPLPTLLLRRAHKIYSLLSITFSKPDSNSSGSMLNSPRTYFKREPSQGDKE